MNTEIFIQRAREVHGDKYDYSICEYVNAVTKMPIVCPEHGMFMQSHLHHVLKSQGCPPCGIRKCAEGISVPFEEFVKRAREKHGNRFEYIKESYSALTSKLRFICPTHGEVQMTGTCHCVSKTGCPKCRHVSTAASNTKSYDEFIRLAKEFHNNKYDYSNVTNFTNRNSRICIICPIHGEFTQTASKHLSGGCRKCADDLHASKLRKTSEEFIEQSIAIWGDIYDYSLINYTSSHTKITIICKIHGEFEKTPGDHISISNPQGCQKCKPKKHSKMAIDWLNYMKVCYNADIQHNENPINNGEHRIKNSLYHSDGYCKETNTIYEFYGSYWHGDPKKYLPEQINATNNKSFGELYQNTLKKIEHCKNEGYNVVECWESDWRRGIKALKKLQQRIRKRKN